MNKFAKIAALSVATLFALPASSVLAVDEHYINDAAVVGDMTFLPTKLLASRPKAQPTSRRNIRAQRGISQQQKTSRCSKPTQQNTVSYSGAVSRSEGRSPKCFWVLKRFGRSPIGWKFGAAMKSSATINQMSCIVKVPGYLPSGVKRSSSQERILSARVRCRLT